MKRSTLMFLFAALLTGCGGQLAPRGSSSGSTAPLAEGPQTGMTPIEESVGGAVVSAKITVAPAQQQSSGAQISAKLSAE